jgi:hypothetical protein
LVRQQDAGWTPDVALAPRLLLPTAGHHFGGGHVQLLLPVWAHKQAGRWSVFGGGGYDINPGAGNRNFWFGGVGAARPVNQRLTLGGEVYYRTADTSVGESFTGVNFGAIYRLAPAWSLLASAGGGVQNLGPRHFAFYAGLKLDY